MNAPVTIKGCKHGIMVRLSSSASYEEIKEAMAEKFESAEKFLGTDKMAISFEGRMLTDEQQELIRKLAESMGDKMTEAKVGKKTIFDRMKDKLN